MEAEDRQSALDNDSIRLPDEMHQHLTINEGPSSSSSRRVRVRSRPTLQTTKSFPPYSQCIGGLGEEGEQDNVLDSELSSAHHPPLTHDMNELFKDTEGKEADLNTRCARDEVKKKWRLRRKERVGGSYEADPDRWGSTRWSGKRRVEETQLESECDDKKKEGGTNSERKLLRSRNSSLELQRKVKEGEKRERSPISAVEGNKEGSGETLEDKAAEEQPEIREGPMTQQWSSPHPILSRLLHSSSSNSSCSSINLSSAESDEVFSEGEDAGSRRRTFRKVRKTELIDI